MTKENSKTVKEPITDYGQPLSFEKVWAMFQETDKQFKEIAKSFEETDRKFQKTDKQFKETDKKIKDLSNLFTTQWGKLIESLVAPGCLNLFKNRGLEIEQSYRNIEVVKDGKQMECDVLLVNSNELVVVEVKTTLRTSNVDEFIEKLKVFKKFFKQYKSYKVYGAVAALTFAEQSDTYAYRSGCFVIKSSGEGLVEIANDKKFKPKEF